MAITLALMALEWVTQLDHGIVHWAANLGWPAEGFVRLVGAAVMGGLVGLEREIRGRQAGFRTYLIVCLGSALVMLVSSHLAMFPWENANNQYTIRVDPGRIAYGVMTGIGFLGAGVIIKGHHGSIRGLTTAAGLWCVAAVGLSVGFGLYLIAAFATALILLALWLLDYFEDLIPKPRYRLVVVRRKWEVGCIAATVGHFKNSNLDVVDASFQRTTDLVHADINLTIAFTDKQQYFNFERKLEGDTTYTLLSTSDL